MDRDVFMHQMTERFQVLYTQALDALDQTPDGQWGQYRQARRTA